MTNSPSPVCVVTSADGEVPQLVDAIDLPTVGSGANERVTEDGSRHRLPRGNHPSRRLERGLRSCVRKFLRSGAP